MSTRHNASQVVAMGQRRLSIEIQQANTCPLGECPIGMNLGRLVRPLLEKFQKTGWRQPMAARKRVRKKN